MDTLLKLKWHAMLKDPSGRRDDAAQALGKTMVIDKGMGLSSFADLLNTAGDYIDLIKLGFGTAALYPLEVLQMKINLAKQRGIRILPGGTFLEIAIAHQLVDEFFHMIQELGFNAVEVSDGSIDLDRALRSNIIRRANNEGLFVCSEYGKKLTGTDFDLDEILRTVELDTSCGAEFIIVEGRESGVGVGIYDAFGRCNDEAVQALIERLADPSLLMWEAPLKEQQNYLLRTFGPNVHLGNIAPQDVLSVEALRRGLRADTFVSQ